MANIYEPTPQQVKELQDWIASRPEHVRKVAKFFRPWKLYRIKDTGHRVTLYSFSEKEDGTVTVTVFVSGKYNKVVFERAVFGLLPEELEECELPPASEEVGVELTDDAEIKAFIDRTRPMVLKDRYKEN